LETTDVMLVPYDEHGDLLLPEALGALGDDLRQHEAQLLKRTCARRKPWYAFHETPPLPDILRPKLLCKDVAHEPHFWIDRAGETVPRHSVYYVVPECPGDLDALAEVLNAEATANWLRAHAQPAANGYRRLQSSVLKRSQSPATSPRWPRTPSAKLPDGLHRFASTRSTRCAVREVRVRLERSEEGQILAGHVERCCRRA